MKQQKILKSGGSRVITSKDICAAFKNLCWAIGAGLFLWLIIHLYTISDYENVCSQCLCFGEVAYPLGAVICIIIILFAIVLFEDKFLEEPKLQ